MRTSVAIATILITAAIVSSASDLKPLPDMTTAKLATAKDAENAVISHVVKDPNDGLSATQVVSATISFALGSDLVDFGKQGDRVWQVHFVEFGETKRIAWVNAETGKVQFIYPEKR